MSYIGNKLYRAISLKGIKIRYYFKIQFLFAIQIATGEILVSNIF